MVDLAFVVGLLAGGLFSGTIIATAHPTLAERIRTGDFAYIWSGPRAILEGDDPYEPDRWALRTKDLVTVYSPTPVYSYPPPVAVALLPLALLPEPLSWALWTIGGLAAAIVSVRSLLRALTPDLPAVAAIVGFLLLGTRAAWATFLVGQGTFLLLAALAGGIVALRDGRDRSAALAALALIAKPHLFLIALIAFAWSAVRRGHIAIVFWSIALTGALGVVSVAFFARGWVTWLATVPSARTSESGTATILNAARDAGAPGLLAALIVLGVMAAIASRFDARGDGYLAIWIVVSLAGAFYENIYDHLFLVVPVVLASAVADRSARSGAPRVLLGSVVVLVVATLALVVVAAERGGFVTFDATIPLAMFAVVAAACWKGRRLI